LCVEKTGEWSEFSLWRFFVLQEMLLGVFAKKMSKMSEFLRGDVGLYVGPGGASTLNLLEETKL